MMDYASLEKEELVRRLKELEASILSGDHEPGNKVYLDLNAHQIELEMQNRELRESQRDLVESLHSYADLYDNAPSGYMTFDWKGCIRELNLTAAALIGEDRARLAGRPFAQFLAKEEMKKFLDHIRNCRNSGGNVSSELTIVRKGSRPVNIQMITTRCGSGNEASFKSSIIDISDLKEAESQKDAFSEEMIRSQRMELMGRLAGGIVHEFTNLMTIVSAYSSLAERESKGSAPMSGYLGQIKGAADRANNLIRRFLIFSNSKTVIPVRLDLNEIIPELTALMAKVVGPKIKLETEVEPGLRTIEGDGVKFEQLVFNLIVNARDSMPFGGRAVLKASNATIGSKGFVRLALSSAISEQGNGAAARTKSADPGLIISELVEDFGGKVEEQGGPGHDLVSVLIPASSGAAASLAEKKIEPNASASGQKVLLVEDERVLRKSVALVLLRHGYTVLEASDAKEALDIFAGEKGNIDLVFTDLILKDRNGMELVEDLLKEKEDVNVLVTSGYMDAEAQWPSIRERGYKYIQKPFEIPDLLTAVRESIR